MKVRAAVFLAVLALLGLAWVLTDPLGAAPDESAHYTRALAVGSGDLVGHPARWQDVPLGPRQQRYIDGTTRRFHVRTELAPLGTTFPCFAFRPTVPASCSDLQRRPGHHFDETYVGAYPPLPYLAAGVATRLAGGRSSAFYLARSAELLVCLALLGAAFLAYADTPGRLAAAALAVTPSALFLSASMNSSGLEFAAGAAFAATLLAAVRRGHGWWLACGTGVVLAWVRPLGPLEVVLLALLLGSPLTRWRDRAVRLPAAVLGLGVLGSAGWNLAEGLHGAPEWTSVPQVFTRLLREQITAFGWIGEVAAPRPVALAWWATVLLLLALAARHRPVQVGAVVVAYLIALGGITLLNAGTGFGVGGRYLLALFPMLPLLAGEHLPRWRRWAPPLVLGAWSLVQGLAWYVNSRRYAVGVQGRHAFWENPSWSPPGGWPVWLALVGVAVLLGLALAARLWADRFDREPAAESDSYSAAARPTGQETPVPPMPQ